MKKGFSLVELSIVLVILGLLVGGILAGQSLIRASELRAVGVEYSRYVTATQAFRDKYFALPGDMTNATSFWGQAASGNACVTTPGTGTQTCNGNGDGVIAPNISSNEKFRYWQQLALAGLIEGTYSGVTDGATNTSATRNNTPTSKLNSGLWDVVSLGAVTGGTYFDGDYSRVYFFGKIKADTVPDNPIMAPQEMWNLDTKIDDGAGGTGRMVDRCWFHCCTNATSSIDYAATYNLNTTGTTCHPVFRQMF